jgi:hydroxyquinol 1,2-dioxygenase
MAGFGLEVNPYFNPISHYMFLRPTGFETTIRGAFPVWEYQQTNALLFGIDVESHWNWNKQWFQNLAISYVNGEDVSNGATGTPCVVQGSVKNSYGQPIANAVIDVWQADDEGFYDVQKENLNHAQARGVLHSKVDGSFNFKSIVAEAYPIPMDGPVGTMLEATRRSPWRPAHLHFMIRADGYDTLITHVFKKGDPYLTSDPVFGVKESLVADWVTGEGGLTTLHFDFVLNATK